MAGKSAASGGLVFHVGLDSSQLQQSMSALKSSIKSATAEWKSQFAEMRAAGDYLGAATAKYDGLTKAMKAQQEMIERQKSELTGLGTRTKENAEQYDKLSATLSNSEKKLTSLSAQQERAKKLMDYEATGIRQNKDELAMLTKEMDSTVKMYQAQGKEQEATAAKTKGLTAQIQQLTEIQGKERSILEKIKTESGESSDAYRNQAIRVNELAAKIAHASSEMDGMSNKATESTSRIDKLNGASHKLSDTFKGSFFGSMAGTAIANVTSRITSGIHDVISAGISENKILEAIRSQWGQLTKSASQGEAMTKVIEEMHERSHYSLQSISALNKAMFGLTKNKQGMEELSTSIQEVGRAKGLDDSKLLLISKRLQQVGSSGRITYADVSKMNKALPGFAAAMAQNMGVSQEQLVQMGKKGKLTAKDFQDTMNSLGKSNSESFSKYNKTWAGGMAIIHDTWDKLSATLMRPVFDGKRSGLTEMAKIMNGKDIQHGATEIGKALSQLASEAVKQLANLAKWVNKNRGQIGDFLNTIKDVVGGIWGAAKPLLTFLVNHPKIFVAAATGVAIITGAIKAFNIVMAITTAIAQANPITWIIDAIVVGAALISVAVYEIIKHWDSIKKFFSGLGKWFVGIWNGIKDGVGNFVSGVKDKWDGMVSGIKDKTGSMANGIKDKFGAAKQWAVDATNKMANQVTDKHSWLNEHTNGAASTMFNGLKKTYKSGHKTLQDATGTFSDLVHGKWSKLGGDIGKTAKSAMSTAKSYFSTGYSTLNKLTGGKLGDLVSSVKKHASSMVSTFKSLPGKMADGIRNGYEKIKDAAIHIGNGLIRGIASGVNGVIGGIDWILGKVHAPKIPKWKPKYYAQGGKAQGLAIVGEAGKHELIKHQDGTIEVSPNKATLYNFKQPVSILGGDKTEALMNLGIIPKFGLGNWIGSAIDFIKGGFSKIANGAESFWDAATHPKQLLNTAIDKFTDLSGLNGAVLDMAKGAVTHIASSAVDWIKSKLTLPGDPGGSGVERWRPYVVRALSMNDLSTSKSMVEKVLRQIATESGGNPKAVQHGYTDINTKTGDLAKGLMQTISATFNANKFSGHGNIFNGFDNLLAALHYAKNRYGSSLSALGKGHGYANGGWSFTDQLAHISEGNKTEVILPLSNRNRAIQLMYQVLDYFSNEDQSNKNQSNATNSGSTDINKLIFLQEQQNQMLSQFMALVAGKNLNIDGKALTNTVNNVNSILYSSNNYQSLGGMQS